MEKYINYYYNIDANNFREDNNKCYFCFNNDNYVVYIFSLSTNDNYIKSKCYLSLYYEVVLNNQHTIITNILEKKIVLFKILINNNRYINWYDILSKSYVYDKNFIWPKLWKTKIDQIEEFVNKTSDIPLINEIVNYYIGMSENALLYLNEALSMYNNKIIDKNVFSHYRVKYQDTLYDFYSPFNIIIDHPSRDIDSYSKELFFNNKFDLKEALLIINKYNLSNQGIMFLISRLLFPTYFFDSYEDYINQKIDIEELKKTLTKINSYERFLASYITTLSNIYNVPKINWLNDVNQL